MVRKLIIAAGLFTLCACTAEIARADSKPVREPKPVVCLNYELATAKLDGKATKVAICSDGKRPVILRSPVEVQLQDEDGFHMIPAVVGWR